MKESEFIEFIRNICSRPGMYTGGTVKETIAFIDGYRYAVNTPISGHLFDRYVSIRHGIGENVVWGYSIIEFMKDEASAFQRIEEIISEFLELRSEMTDEQLLSYARNKSSIF